MHRNETALKAKFTGLRTKAMQVLPGSSRFG